MAGRSTQDASSEGAEEPSRPPRSRRRKLVMGCTVALLGIALVEGLASIAVFTYDALFASQRVAAERHYTHHDPQLGWASTPGVHLEDFFAPGRDVTIGPQGFRGAKDSRVERPAGKTRIVCSGDSFTFGYGVGDDDTWCCRLEGLLPTLDVVNMGQAGYGLDQAYLWYLRDGRPLEQDIHVLAVISRDFARMTSDEFGGYAKPYLVATDGPPAAAGTPVPDDAYRVPWATQNRDILRELGVVDIVSRMSGDSETDGERPPVMSLETAVNVARDAVRELDRSARAEGRQFVFVYLPSPEDMQPNSRDFMRTPFLDALRADGITVIDLVADFRATPPDSPAGFFIGDGELTFEGAAGHLTPDGNRQVAERLLARMRAVPSLAPLLGALR